MDLNKVKATNFYKDDGDKIKLNRFLYEYANALYMEIAKSPKLTRYRKANGEKRSGRYIPSVSLLCVSMTKLSITVYPDYVDSMHRKMRGCSPVVCSGGLRNR